MTTDAKGLTALKHLVGIIAVAVVMMGGAIIEAAAQVSGDVEPDRRIRRAPDIDRAFREYGIPPYAQNDFERAVADFNRGNAYNREGDFDPAIAEYGSAIKINPGYAEAC